MDLDFLKQGAAKFAYELRKNFPIEESPIDQYVVDKGVVVISTKKLYVFFCEMFIDYKGDLLNNVEISKINYEENSCNIFVERKLFEFVFESRKDLESLMKYYDKYLVK